MQRVTAVADTSFVVALVNQQDDAHHQAIAVYASQGQILLPQTVSAEVAYLLRRDAGEGVLIKFLQSLVASRFQLEALPLKDVEWTTQILEQHQGSRIDFVDASVMAIAERHAISLVLTLDRRDFSIYRPRNGKNFLLAP